MNEYCNYHKHDHISSIFTPDTHIHAEEYIKRAVELGHTTYFTTNHGTGGDIFEAKTLCDKYNIRCLYGIEGYIVPHPLEKDNRNYHIMIIPRTDKARKKLNLITSRANEEGYYYKPRIFLEDLLKLNKDDVYITTACIAGIIRDEDVYYDIFLPLVNHFQQNIFLEVQPHNAEKQKILNRKCLELSAKHNLQLIGANDSHYIYPEQSKDRDLYLEGKGIKYSDEDDFILDYPNYDTMFSRFQQQGILTDNQIKQAIENTKIFLECEDIHLDKEIKMPSIYRQLLPDEKIAELKKHINQKFAQICKQENIVGDVKRKYIKGIKEEMQVIEDTKSINTADYFLFNEKNTELAINKYGGILTRTGRGSCGAFYINHILGITQLDRFVSPIVLYPERFMSTSRLLENRAMPDIDNNVVSQEPFVNASKELLGKHGCYPMVAYGTMKEGEAFRNVCRSHKIEYSKYNEVAKNIEQYENDEKWKPYIEESKKFVGCVVSASVHPCAYCLDNKDLREEYGIVRIGDYLCVMVTSAEADEYKLLKNDYLVVSCWKLISETFQMIKQPILTIKELLSQIDDNIWNLYADGITCTLNQCDGDWATSMLQTYKPKTVSELSMFVAAVRPFFETWRDKYINRQEYTTGSKELDKVLESTQHYIIFQENLMQYFEWLGVTPAESIGLIKKISKKKIHKEDFDNLTERIKKQWIINTGSDKMFDETWQMVQSCMAYGFCSAHALAVCIDSLYGAYLKYNYPLEYYTVCFNNYFDDESKTQKLTSELDYFHITLKPIKFRHSQSIYSMDKENNCIYKGISSIKYLNSKVAEQLYSMRYMVFSNFIDFLKINPCNTRQTEILIKLNFFKEFGKSHKLLEIYKIYNQFYNKTQISKDKINIDSNIILKYAKETEKKYIFNDMQGFVNELCATIQNVDIPLPEMIQAQLEYLGYIDYVNPQMRNCGYIVDVDTKYSPKITIYDIDTGKYNVCKISKKRYADSPLIQGGIIEYTIENRHKMRKNNGEWETLNEMEQWIDTYVRR